MIKEKGFEFRVKLQGEDVRGCCTVRLNIEKAMEIRIKLSRLKSFVGDR